MYRGKETLRGVGERYEMTDEEKKEYLRCANDILYFAEKYFYIVSLDKGIIKIPLRKFQKKIIKAALETPEGKRHLIMKIGRQSGKSTVVSLFVLWLILFSDDPQTVAIMANKEDTAKEMLDRIKFAYERLPLWMQQGVVEGGWNKKSIELENKSKVFVGATSGDSISGKSVNLLILDEFAKVPNHIAEDFIRSAYPVVSSSTTAKIIIISTPKGLNHFYEFWQRAGSPDTDFFRIAVPYWEVPGRDEAWKQREIRNIGIVSFRQEYECEFLGSSTTLLEAKTLARLSPTDPKEIKWNGALKIYHKPIPGARYIIGSDVGKGIGSDSSTAHILRVVGKRKFKEAAVFCSDTIKPSKFAEILNDIGTWYNNAHLLIECNDYGAIVANKLQEDYDYENLVVVDEREPGIRANRKNKPEACMWLKECMDEGYYETNDADTINELSRFEEVSHNVFKASSGHDDNVIALMWCLYIMLTEYKYDIWEELGFTDDESEYFNSVSDSDEEREVSGLMRRTPDSDWDDDFIDFGDFDIDDVNSTFYISM